MRQSVVARIAALLALVHLSWVPSAARDEWIRVQSPNFFLVGNDSEKDMRRVALKFEQFREAFARILPKVKLTSSVPTRVVVFKSDSSFKPFKPLYQGKPASLAGFFQKGMDVNHICLTSEYSEERPFAAILHEYVHQLTGDNVALCRFGFARVSRSTTVLLRRLTAIGRSRSVNRLPVTSSSCVKNNSFLSPSSSPWAMIHLNTTNGRNKESSMPSRGPWFTIS
jgi:hypothetical protein